MVSACWEMSNQSLSGFLFQSHIAPAVGVADFHGNGGALAAGAQEEGGEAGNHFGEGESAHVADLGIFSSDGAVLDHLSQLHTGDHAADVAGFVHRVEVVMHVGQFAVHRGVAGGVAELNVGIFGSGLEHIALMAEAGGENDIAALLRQVDGGFIGVFGLGHVVLAQHLIVGDAQSSLSFLQTIEVVGGITFVFITDGDVADFDLFHGDTGGEGAGAAGNQAEGKKQTENFLHGFHPPVAGS